MAQRKGTDKQKNKDWAIRITLQRCVFWCFRWLSRSSFMSDNNHVNVNRHDHYLIWNSCWTPENVNNLYKIWPHYKTNGSKYESLLHESYKTVLKHEDMFEQYEQNWAPLKPDAIRRLSSSSSGSCHV